MKNLTVILLITTAVGAVGSYLGWQQSQQLSAENQALRQQLASSESALEETTRQAKSSVASELEKLRADVREVHKLRGEVRQLRGGAKALSQLQESNRRLAEENRALRVSLGEAESNVPDQVERAGAFPKESWEFLGYASPEDALVSAIWTMQQGDPQAYFDSLAPEEQERMAERWAEKSEDEVAEKHQSDVSAISGLQVLNQRTVSDTEVVMDVYIEGPDRMQTVSMQRIGQDWKFKGYVEQEGQ